MRPHRRSAHIVMDCMCHMLLVQGGHRGLSLSWMLLIASLNEAFVPHVQPCPQCQATGGVVAGLCHRSSAWFFQAMHNCGGQSLQHTAVCQLLKQELASVGFTAVRAKQELVAAAEGLVRG